MSRQTSRRVVSVRRAGPVLLKRLTCLDGARPAVHHPLDDDLKQLPVPEAPGAGGGREGDGQGEGEMIALA